MKIIIDNGHGKNTRGKSSPKWKNGKHLEEWEFTRDISDQVNVILKAEQYDSEILVPEIHDIRIKERCDRANEIHKATPSILISIHGNAAPNQNHEPNGIETFHYSPKGKILAKYFQDELVKMLGWKDRGVRRTYQKRTIHRGTPEEKEIIIYKIAITKYADMLTVLTENGFYTNFDQCQLMTQPEIRSQIALAHVSAVKQYLFNLNS